MEVLVLTGDVMVPHAFRGSDFVFAVGTGCVVQAGLLQVCDLK